MRTAATLVRRAAPAAALLVAAALALPAAAATTDGVLADLQRSDVHASAAELGPQGAVEARAELRAVAAELDGSGRPVKLAVVAGRGETRRLLAYARRLRDELGYEGTVVLTTPAARPPSPGRRRPPRPPPGCAAISA